MERTTWIEIPRDALALNLDSVSRRVRVPVCAVVKANAYGHGLAETARTFVDAGAPMLGVTRIEEARALRAARVDAPVLLMAPVPDPAEAVELRCALTVGSAEGVGSLPAAADVHLKIDTGMGRLGVPPSEAGAAAHAIAARAHLAGVWTHFADAAGSSGPRQLAAFTGVVEALRAEGLSFTAHAANSAATIALPESRFDMVRVGTLLYGQHPVGARAPWPLNETFIWYARVAAVRTVASGTTVGYGSEWRSRGEVRVATIPVGYADGFGVDPDARTPTVGRAARRFASSLARRRPRVVRFGDLTAPVVGRVAMQALTVDVTRVPGVEVGSVARIPARRMMVDPSIERIHR